MEKKKRISFFVILFTFFMDQLSWSIVFPIFVPLFLSNDQGLFSAGVSQQSRDMLLGVFFFIYPFFQFLGAPILGEVADHYGRKKALLFSLFGSSFGFFLGAWSVQQGDLILLFVSRVLSGFFSGNLSICLASVADLSETKQGKLEKFGYLSFLGGFSFIAGSFLGGKLSDHHTNPLFFPALPLWISTGLSIFNTIFLYKFFTETSELHKNRKWNFFESVKEIKEVFLLKKKLKFLYLIFFLFLLGWMLLFQFTPTLIVKKFQATSSQIGDLEAFVGICWALGSLLVNRFFNKWISPEKNLIFSFLFFALFCFFISFQSTLGGVYTLLGGSFLVGGMIWPLYTTFLSDLAGERVQGKLLGISQALQSLAMAGASLLGGFLSSVHTHTLFIVAAVCGMFSCLIFVRTLKMK